jgi:D-tyrosyl-tRNA(Tyr) deacylase
MAPKYAIEAVDAEMFRQAIEKNVEKVTKVVISRDETNLAQKEKIKKLAEDYGIPVELI